MTVTIVRTTNENGAMRMRTFDDAIEAIVWANARDADGYDVEVWSEER